MPDPPSPLPTSPSAPAPFPSQPLPTLTLLGPNGNPVAPAAATLASLLTTALQDTEALRTQLAHERRHVEKLERLCQACSDPDRAAVARRLADAEARAERAEKGREEAEAKLRAVRQGWSELEKYMGMLEVRAADARASFARGFADHSAAAGVVPPHAANSALPAQLARMHVNGTSASSTPVPAPAVLPSQIAASASMPSLLRTNSHGPLPSTESVPASLFAPLPPPPPAISSSIPLVRPRTNSVTSALPGSLHYPAEPPSKRQKPDPLALKDGSAGQGQAYSHMGSVSPSSGAHSSGRAPPAPPAVPTSRHVPFASTSAAHSASTSRKSYTPSPPSQHAQDLPDIDIDIDVDAELSQAVSSSHSRKRSGRSRTHSVSDLRNDPYTSSEEDEQEEDELSVDDMILAAAAASPRTESRKAKHGLPSAQTLNSLSNKPYVPRGGAGTAPPGTVNEEGLRCCMHCQRPGRYKDGRCIEKWGPGPQGPGTVCDRCRKKIKRNERREGTSLSQSQSYSSLSSQSQGAPSNSSTLVQDFASQESTSQESTLSAPSFSPNPSRHAPLPIKRVGSDLSNGTTPSATSSTGRGGQSNTGAPSQPSNESGKWLTVNLTASRSRADSSSTRAPSTPNSPFSPSPPVNPSDSGRALYPWPPPSQQIPQGQPPAHSNGAWIKLEDRDAMEL